MSPIGTNITNSVHKVVKINSLTRAINGYTDDQDLAERIADWLDEWLPDDDDFDLDVESDQTVTTVEAFYDEEFNKFFVIIPDSKYVDCFTIARGVVDGLIDYLQPEPSSFDSRTVSFFKVFGGH